MENTITVNDVEYVRADSVTPVVEGSHVIVIADRGWIFVGKPERMEGNLRTVLTEASVVRRWTNGKGIGGLAVEANKGEYTLDPVGTLEVYSPIVTIVCQW